MTTNTVSTNTLLSYTSKLESELIGLERELESLKEQVENLERAISYLQANLSEINDPENRKKLEDYLVNLKKSKGQQQKEEEKQQTDPLLTEEDIQKFWDSLLSGNQLIQTTAGFESNESNKSSNKSNNIAALVDEEMIWSVLKEIYRLE